MTVVAIHQPQYLPWVPYCDKSDQCDIFVYLDTVQFQKNGVQNRNQIKTAQGPIWLSVPAHASLNTAVKDVTIDGSRWVKKHIRSIEMNYSKARHIDLFHGDLVPVLERGWTHLSDLNIAVTEWMFSALGIASKRIRASELDVTGSREDLLLNICKAVSATTYLSGQGAKSYMDPGSFKNQGVDIRFQEYRSQPYEQCHRGIDFVPDLSALDLILNMGKDSRDIMLKGRRQSPHY